jgi:ParB-like chromosome segregation protein Spo0J
MPDKKDNENSIVMFNLAMMNCDWSLHVGKIRTRGRPKKTHDSKYLDISDGSEEKLPKPKDRKIGASPQSDRKRENLDFATGSSKKIKSEEEKGKPIWLDDLKQTLATMQSMLDTKVEELDKKLETKFENWEKKKEKTTQENKIEHLFTPTVKTLEAEPTTEIKR